MAILTLRSTKGAPLTNSELDANFTALNADVSSRLLASSNLSDLTNAATARSNLGLGNVENKSSATIRGELTSSNVTTALGFTPFSAAGGAVTGFTTVRSSLSLGASSVNPGQIGFNRNIETNAIINALYSAYQLQNTEGTLALQYFNSSGGYVGQHTFAADGAVRLSGNTGIGGVVSSTARLRVVGTGTSSEIARLEGATQGAYLLINQLDDPASNTTRSGISFRKNNVEGGAISTEYNGTRGIVYYDASGSTGSHAFYINGSDRLRLSHFGGLSFSGAGYGSAGQFLKSGGSGAAVAWGSLTSGEVTTALGFTPYNSTNPDGYITNTGNARVGVENNGTLVGTRRNINFIPGTGISLSISDDAANEEVDVTITSTATGGVSSFNTRTGAVTLSSGDVTTALGFTPYNSTNPSGYITSSFSGFMLRSTSAQTNPNTNFASSAYRFDPNANNPTNEHYAIITYGNEGNVTGQLATHFVSGQTFTRAFNSTWSAWRTQLDSVNFSSFALPLIGGTLTGRLTRSTSGGINSASARFALTTSGQADFHIASSVNGSSPTNTQQYGLTFSPSGGSTQAGILFSENGSDGTAIGFFCTNSYAAGPQLRASIDPVGNFNAVGAITQNGNQVLHAGNYTSYAPSLTGSGASGTWGINVTGSAGSAGWATYNQILDTRAGQYTPNDYQDYRATYEFTNQIVGSDWHTAMTLQGWHNGYAAWQIIGPASTSAHENWYLRSGINTSWNPVRTILHSGNFSSYAPSLTGSGASGTWGINITGQAGSVNGGMRGSWTGDITWNAGVNVNINGESSFDMFSGGQFGVWNSSSGTWSIRCPWEARTEIGQAGSRGLYIYGPMDATGVVRGSSIGLNGGFTISDPGSGYGLFNNWVQLPGFHGFYSPQNSAHFYPNNLSYGSWRIDGTRNGWHGIEFASAMTLMMNDNACGVHRNSGGGWRFYVEGNSLFCGGNITAYWSDERLKENLRAIRRESLDILKGLTAYRFNWNSKVAEINAEIPVGKEEIGLIAQHVQRALPDAVNVNKAGAAPNQEDFDYLTINYDRITPLVVEAVNIHEEDITDLKAKIAHLEALVAKLIGA